ncbi:MAG: DHHA1 domain-containing protein [Holdemania filiformis]
MKKPDRAGIVSGFFPHRQGYGLSAQTVQLARDKGYSLILTVDNGVAASCADLANSWAWSDGHRSSRNPAGPECLTLLHPTRMGKPWQYCCRPGWRCSCRGDAGPRKRPIMLAAIATIADMMPLWEENRILVRLGLKYLNERQFTAIEALNEKKCELWTEKEVAYQIVPKLNAAGRLAELCNINNIVRYLLLEDPAQIESAAAQIRQINQKRRQMSDKMTKTAMEQMHPEDAFHVIADKEFHEGIIGLVAGRIMNETHRPTLVLAPSAQGYKGSVRSVPGLDIQVFFEDLRGYLIQFGGHAQAAGIEVAADQLEPLRQAILAKMETLDLALPEPTLQVLPVSAQEINLTALHELDQLAPFGQQFEPVTFEVSGLTILQYAKMKEVYPKWQTTNGVDLIDAIS